MSATIHTLHPQKSGLDRTPTIAELASVSFKGRKPTEDEAQKRLRMAQGYDDETITAGQIPPTHIKHAKIISLTKG